MELTLEHFSTLLVKSRLYSPEAAQTLFERWKKQTPKGHDPKLFIRWLVAQGHLTEYQAALLGRGQTDGLVLGTYKILERIRRRSDAEVFKAVREPGGELVTMEILQADRARDEKALARFQREAKLAALLQHPALLATTGVGVDGGVHYIVKEFAEGETIQELLQQRGKLPVRESVRLAFLAALGLQHIHEKGLIHGRLTPGNLLLSPPPQPGDGTRRCMVKLLNPVLDPQWLDDRKDLEEWTAGSVTLDASDYLAPDRTRDIRADIYSLGCVLYHLLAGLPPFADKNREQKRRRHAKEPPWSLRKVNPQIPEGLDEAVLKMLHKEPTGRYGTPMHAAEALKAFLAEPEPAKASGEPPELPPLSGEPAKQPPKGEKPAREPAGDSGPAVPEGIPVNLRNKTEPAPARPPARAAGSAPSTRAKELEELDVEPVTAADLVMEFFRFRSRDWFMLVLGALAGGGLMALVWLIVALAGGGNEAPPSEIVP